MTEKIFPGIGKTVSILGIPLGYGAGQIGSELGVEAVRLSKFRGKLLQEHIKDLGYDVIDVGDVNVTKPKSRDSDAPGPKHLAEMIVSSQESAKRVKECLSNGYFPVILGGDHSVAIGSFSGVSSHFHDNNQDVGLIWFDAHADINTPQTSSSGNIHGMPSAVLMGEGVPELVNIDGFSPKLQSKYFAHVGGRDFDQGEKERIYELGLRDHFFTMSDIDERGMLACVKDAIAIASKASAGYAVTFDIDMIDPRFAPGSGTLVRGGTTYREAHLALETVAADGGMVSFELVEVNPLLDQSNITVELASELILSALGKTIL